MDPPTEQDNHALKDLHLAMLASRGSTTSVWSVQRSDSVPLIKLAPPPPPPASTIDGNAPPGTEAGDVRETARDVKSPALATVPTSVAITDPTTLIPVVGASARVTADPACATVNNVSINATTTTTTTISATTIAMTADTTTISATSASTAAAEVVQQVRGQHIDNQVVADSSAQRQAEQQRQPPQLLREAVLSQAPPKVAPRKGPPPKLVRQSTDQAFAALCELAEEVATIDVPRLTRGDIEGPCVFAAPTTARTNPTPTTTAAAAAITTVRTSTATVAPTSRASGGAGDVGARKAPPAPPNLAMLRMDSCSTSDEEDDSDSDSNAVTRAPTAVRTTGAGPRGPVGATVNAHAGVSIGSNRANSDDAPSTHESTSVCRPCDHTSSSTHEASGRPSWMLTHASRDEVSPCDAQLLFINAVWLCLSWNALQHSSMLCGCA
jgi:hypothetical protein